MKEEREYRITRREFIGAGVAGATMLAVPPLLRARSRSLKVGVYGGYFKDSFDKHIFPDFSKETGIEVQSVAEPTGEAWLVQLENAARAGQAPADVSMIAQVPRLKGVNARLWAPLDPTKLGNRKYLFDNFVHTYDDGSISGLGAVSWYITLVTNTDVYPEAPTSWNALWDPANKDRLGLLALATNSFLLEITAKTYFNGHDSLQSRDDIRKVLDKLSEVKPNVRLWYRDEGQFQQALQSGEIPMGQYYHDVTGLAAADGFPVRSTFPREGGVLDSGSWCVSKASDKLDEAHVFINYMCRPDVQAKLSRKVGTAPTVKREHLDLSDKEFAAVASDIPPILPYYQMYLERGDWISDQWTAMITG
ncbi:MAG TPA: ABC transporter substrate-binding protein [Gammaproteobacteria bacterium]|nr:ABC transporter substrate-binding protein [Gammaproteobacteria bacterium]